MRRDFLTVVTGVPRSGTALMMRMLGAGGLPLFIDTTRPADRHNPLGYFEHDEVRRTRAETAWVARAAGHAVKVVHALVPLLPDGTAYRVILMRRPLDRVVDSQHAMLEHPGAIEGGLSRARLVELFAAQLEEVEAWMAGRSNVSLLRVEADRAVAAPADVAAEVARFLGGGLDEAAMAAAVEPSLWHTRG